MPQVSAPTPPGAFKRLPAPPRLGRRARSTTPTVHTRPNYLGRLLWLFDVINHGN